jgi:phosphomannomutase/GTP:adenosylcobinamide-phosphate guanylyltransferase
MWAVILAGGRGTRMGGKTPKALVEVLGKPLILHVIENIEQALPGTKFRIVANKRNLKTISLTLGKDFHYVVQEKPLGTADALAVGLDELVDEEDVLVAYTDTPLIRSNSIVGVVSRHKLKNAAATLLSGISRKKYPYAIIARDAQGKLVGVYEESETPGPPPWEYNIGLYTFKVGLVRSYFPKLSLGRKGQYYIPELVNVFLKNGLPVEIFTSFDESEYLGVNTKDDLKKAEEILIQRSAEREERDEERFIKFGTGGWRARIGRGFTSGNVRRLSQAIANHLACNNLEDKGIVIGYDNRFLSEEFAKVAAEVFAANNIKVCLSRSPVPTPVVTFTVLKKRAGGGMVITASHNPPEYNGVKLETHKGLPALPEVTQEVEYTANSLAPNEILWTPFIKARNAGYIELDDFRRSYLDYLEEKFDIQAMRKAGLRVCFDSMYGSGTSTIQFALMNARCELTLLHARRDPLFGGRSPIPTKSALILLINAMKEGDYHVGIGVDGDADRMALVDERGRFIHPNEVILLLFHYLHEVKGMKGGIIRNVSTSHNLDAYAELVGEEAFEVPVGFRHIAWGMLEHRALIGGESSGGVTFRDHVLEKDGIYAAMLVLEMLATAGRPLSALLREVFRKLGNRRLHYFEERLSLTPELKARASIFLSRDLENVGGRRVKVVRRIDGVKLVFTDGSWALVRFSGTEPILRIATEDYTPKGARALAALLKRKVIQFH